MPEVAARGERLPLLGLELRCPSGHRNEVRLGKAREQRDRGEARGLHRTNIQPGPQPFRERMETSW